MAESKEDSAIYGSTLTRGLAVLRSFSETNTSLSATEIAKLTDIPQPTVWRLCKTLQAEGYLTADLHGTRFRPGLGVLRLGISALSQLSLAQHARAYLAELAANFSVVAGLASPDGLSMRVIDRHQSPSALIAYNIHIGSTISVATSGSGWAYLAGLDTERRNEVIDRISRETPDVWKQVGPIFEAALADYMTHGFIISSNIFGIDLTAVAVPITDSDGRSIYSLYCSAMSSLLPDDVIHTRLAPRLVEIASELRMVLELER